MKKNFYSLITLCLLSLSLFFTACSKEKQLLLTDSPKISNATETAKTVSALKTETATTYGKIITVAFSSTNNSSGTIFTNSSVIIDKKNYDIDSYDWDFGDGKTETRPDNTPFTHIYLASKNYNVKLTANLVDPLTRAPIDGPFISTKRITATAIDIIPTASFTVNYLSNGVIASFNNTSTNGVKYKWYFGDGDTSIIENPIHKYKKDGDYAVELTVTSITGHKTTITNPVTIKENLIAKLEVLNLLDPFKKEFKDLSLVDYNAISSYSLDFGDRTTRITGRASDSRYEHLYQDGGDYTATLTITSIRGNTSSITKTISIPYDLVAQFGAYGSSFDPTLIQFINLSHNATSFTWDFGDGSTSTSTSTEIFTDHYYSRPGKYIVTLVASDGKGGTKTYSHEIVVK